MATQTLIIANTSPTVEIYRVNDGANSYIIAQDGYSTNSPNTVSIQIDYSPFLERIATSLETIAVEISTANSSYTLGESLVGMWVALNNLRLDVGDLVLEANSSTQHLNTIASNFEFERAVNVSEMKYADYNDDNFDRLTVVSNEVQNPTQF